MLYWCLLKESYSFPLFIDILASLLLLAVKSADNYRVATLQSNSKNYMVAKAATVCAQSAIMATETKTETEVKVEANAKCVALIRKIQENAAQGASLKVQLADVARSEGARLGLDEIGIRRMLALSWREAQGFKSSDEKLQAAFDQGSRPDISKIMRLAYPVDKKAESNLVEAIKHNSLVGATRDRIGENKLLDISRGNLTFLQAKANKAKPRRTGAVDKNVPPAEQLYNRVVEIIGDMGAKLSLDEIESVFARIVKERKAKTS
jgi:hypothetical protein